MLTCLLKRVLPFTLTFAVGAALGWLFNFQGAGGRFAEVTTRLEKHEAPFGYGLGYGHSCRMYRRDLVAETKPLVIFFKPDASPTRALAGHNKSVWVRVTFGADGKVQGVEQLQPLLPDVTLREVERAARQIQFTPETINGVPVTVTKNVEIHFMADE